MLILGDLANLPDVPPDAVDLIIKAAEGDAPKKSDTAKKESKKKDSPESEVSGLPEIPEMPTPSPFGGGAMPVGTMVRDILSGQSGVVVDSPPGDFGDIVFVKLDSDGQTHPVLTSNLEVTTPPAPVMPLGMEEGGIGNEAEPTEESPIPTKTKAGLGGGAKLLIFGRNTIARMKNRKVTAGRAKFSAGDTVTFHADYDLWPSDVVRKGETGVMLSGNRVLLNEIHPVLSRKNNEIGFVSAGMMNYVLAPKTKINANGTFEVSVSYPDGRTLSFGSHETLEAAKKVADEATEGVDAWATIFDEAGNEVTAGLKVKASKFSFDDIGVENDQYFQGHGGYVGIGNSAREAANDALENAATSGVEITPEMEKAASEMSDVNEVENTVKKFLEKGESLEEALQNSSSYYYVGLNVGDKVKGDLKITARTTWYELEEDSKYADRVPEGLIDRQRQGGMGVPKTGAVVIKLSSGEPYGTVVDGDEKFVTVRTANGDEELAAGDDFGWGEYALRPAGYKKPHTTSEMQPSSLMVTSPDDPRKLTYTKFKAVLSHISKPSHETALRMIGYVPSNWDVITATLLKDGIVLRAKRGRFDVASFVNAGHTKNEIRFMLGSAGVSQLQLTRAFKTIDAAKPTKPKPAQPAGNGMVWAWDQTTQDWYLTDIQASKKTIKARDWKVKIDGVKSIFEDAEPDDEISADLGKKVAAVLRAALPEVEKLGDGISETFEDVIDLFAMDCDSVEGFDYALNELYDLSDSASIWIG